MIFVLWGLVDSPLLGVAFMLCLTALSVTRYRQASYRWLVAAEAVLCVGFAFLWLPALLGLWLPVIGVLESQWDRHEEKLLRQSYIDRQERLKQDDTREYYAGQLRNAARFAELAERSRIAQDIHDHVGHEISGASIALQTAIKLYEKNDLRAEKLLQQSAKRLEIASEHLREAVYNLKPARITDLDAITRICEDFTFCRLKFSVSGDLGGSQPHLWELLIANLKEALTNVSRHSSATLVNVRLDGNADSIKMQVSDNGSVMGNPSDDTAQHKQAAKNMPPPFGLGLSGIRDRVRLAGGTLTVSSDNGFTVVCVLPKGENNEITDSR
jgi:signal transduction histidine kinase